MILFKYNYYKHFYKDNNYENEINKYRIMNVNTNFNSYLAGLFEGDGHIIFHKGNNQSKKRITKIRKVTIGITFNIKDLSLCKHLKSRLEHG
jgi:hypothetical protein